MKYHTLFFSKIKKDVANLSSAAVVIGTLRVYMSNEPWQAHCVQPDGRIHYYTKGKERSYFNPLSANHDCSRRQILQHLSQFSTKIRYDIIT